MHMFDDGFVFSYEIFRRCVAVTLLFALIIFMSWFLPLVLHYIFARLLGTEVSYRPEKDYGNRYATDAKRMEYMKAPFVRTHFFQVLYQIIRIFLTINAIWIAFWIFEYDPWVIVAGLGMGTFIIIFHMADYIQGVLTYFILMGNPERPLILGDVIQIGPVRGRIVSIGLWQTQLRVPRALQSQPQAQPSLAAGAAAPATSPLTSHHSPSSHDMSTHHLLEHSQQDHHANAVPNRGHLIFPPLQRRNLTNNPPPIQLPPHTAADHHLLVQDESTYIYDDVFLPTVMLMQGFVTRYNRGTASTL